MRDWPGACVESFGLVDDNDLIIRHWEVTARVHKAFLFGFLDLFDFLIFLLTWRELAWVSWSVRRGRARSCEYVWIAQSHSGRSSSLDARGPGPDLTWQRTLAVVVCAALEGVFKGRK
jgi:hypothetical protein